MQIFSYIYIKETFTVFLGIYRVLQKSCYSCTFTARSSAWAATKVIIDAQLESIKEAKTYKNERVITSKQDSHINIEGSSKRLINFCANNYLGLSVSVFLINVFKTA